MMRRSAIDMTLLSLAVALLASCGNASHPGQVVTRRDGYVYRGGMENGMRHGYGVLSMGDSVVYAGQWVNGKRQGTGVSSDSLGREIVATWQDDSIISGRRVDTVGVYVGHFTNAGVPMGHGMYITNREMYDGNWNKGRRDGFGIYISADRFRLGEWSADRFMGERLTYTDSRIYGIDVSRFQHDVGRKTYPVEWKSTKVVNLGTMSRKKIHGKVDYPISFCFIKSTEGTTVKNKYYLSDYREAKRNGITCGAYHFFSTTSPAALQARFFLSNTQFQKGDFPPVLDVEPSDKQIRDMGGADALFNAIRTWCGAVEKHTGSRPILYVSQMFVNKYLPSAPDVMRDYDFWIARYGEYKPEIHLVFWQLSPDGKVAGIKPEVDINVFNGYSEQFMQYKQKRLLKTTTTVVPAVARKKRK